MGPFCSLQIKEMLKKTNPNLPQCELPRTTPSAATFSHLLPPKPVTGSERSLFRSKLSSAAVFSAAQEVPRFLPRLSYWQKLANSAQAICTATWTDSSQWKETEVTPRLSKRPWCSCWKKNRSASPALKKVKHHLFQPGVLLPRLSLVTGKWRKQFYHSDCHSKNMDTPTSPGKKKTQKFG